MAINSTQEKFQHELGDIYDAENRFLQGMQEMVSQAGDPNLQSSIQTHILQTQQQIQNLEQVFSLLGAQPQREACDAAIGLVREAQKTMGEAGSDAIRDCFIGGAAAKVEHYEIASYRGLITGAQMMGQQQTVDLLQQNLQQEEQTAQLLEQSAPQLLQRAMQEEGMQPKGNVSGSWQGQNLAAQDTTGAVQAKGMLSGDPDVVVDNAGAEDILVDNTQAPRGTGA